MIFNRELFSNYYLGLGGQIPNQLISNTNQASQSNINLTSNQANLLNIANLNSSSASNSAGQASGGTNSQAAPIQNQLIDSFRMAVTLGLISPDLLNTKLPQDVLTLLYQLFQTLNHYSNSLARMTALNKRRGQISAGQYKTELDMLQQESQTYRENLTLFQNKINTAHLLLKQQQQQGQSSQQSQANKNFPGSGAQTPPVSLGGLGGLVTD